MSLTGLDLRKRLRRRAVRALDQLILLLEEGGTPAEASPPGAAPTPPPAAPTPPPAAPTPAAPAPDLEPLPSLPKREAPLVDQVAEPAAARPASRAGGATEAAQKAAVSPEERQRQHWARTREGILRFVHEHGGRSGLRELHDHSERTYFVAHVGFSRLMEELTDEGLLDYDHDTAVATLTDAGLAELG